MSRFRIVETFDQGYVCKCFDFDGMPLDLNQVDQVEKIQSLRCNCDGTKISFFAESPKGDGTESKLFVYDEYLDKFLCYDFGDRRPVSHYWDDEDCKLLACHIICSEVSRGCITVTKCI